MERQEGWMRWCMCLLFGEGLPDSDATETTEKLPTLCPSRKKNITKSNWCFPATQLHPRPQTLGWLMSALEAWEQTIHERMTNPQSPTHRFGFGQVSPSTLPREAGMWGEGNGDTLTKESWSYPLPQLRWGSESLKEFICLIGWTR